MHLVELAIYVFATVVSIFALIAGLTTNFFSLIPEPIAQITASFCLALLTFLIGDRIAYATSEGRLKKEIKEMLNGWRSATPILDYAIQFPSSDSAMEYLCARISHAQSVLNTKISKLGIPPARKVGDKYKEAIKGSIKKGLKYIDIVSPAFEDYAKELENSSSGTKGHYKFKIVNINSPSFLNFIILNFPGGQEELIFGWATSEYFGTEQPAYKIMDKRIITYFKNYHSALFNVT